MTDRVFPSNNDRIEETVLGNIVRYAGGSDPGWVVPNGDTAISSTARNGFEQTNTGLTVTIDTGEAFVNGIWIDRDITTDVTLDASTSDQTVYVGIDSGLQDTIIIGLSSAFSADDPKMALWTFDTDGSGVTSATDERYTSPGRGLDVPNADYADNADQVDGQDYADIQNWVNTSADVPNADYADNAGALSGYNLTVVASGNFTSSTSETISLGSETGIVHRQFLISAFAEGATTGGGKTVIIGRDETNDCAYIQSKSPYTSGNIDSTEYQLVFANLNSDNTYYYEVLKWE